MSLTPTLGSEEDFEAIRRFLDDAGYTAERVSARTGVAAIVHFQEIRQGRTVGVSLDDVLDLLIRLFMDTELIPAEVVRRWIPAAVLESMRRLGLVTAARSDPNRCHATVLLYPTEAVYIISDLDADPDPQFGEPLRDDVVYPAITLNTTRFLALLPRTPCRRFLELCAGTGIAALVAARTADHSWAADITERSTLFATFNARLNRLGNVTAVQGDLYQPVAGQRFDRIAAHPPYVPAKESKVVFRDGGEDGEQITRRVMGGLADHLEPGGRLYCTCMATDRTDGRLEQRVRGMLGPQAGEFDVLVVTRFEYDAVDYYTRVALSGRSPFSNLEPTLRQLAELGVEQLVYSTIVVQRRATERPVFTRRRQLGQGSGWAEVEWLLGWETAALDPGTTPRILAGRPRVAPSASLQMRLRPAEGNWLPTEVIALAEWPFSLRAKCPVWGADLLAQCDGSVTGQALADRLRAGGVVPAAEAEASVAALVRVLVSAGILTLDDFPLPAVASPERTQHPVA